MKNPNVINIDITDELSVAKLRPDYDTVRKGYMETESDALLLKILNTPNTEELYEITGTKYYVSVDGDDNNDGKSPEAPIKTLAAIHALPLQDGDAVLFKRGDIFRLGDTIEAVDGVTYGSYGEGAKPRIFGSPENYAENDNWVEVKPNIWEIDFDFPYASGCTLDYGKIKGIQKKFERFDGMAENGDYFHDEEAKKFYLYSDEKPSDRWHDIEIMPNICIFRLRDSRKVTIDNICMKYTSFFGVHAPDIKDNICITNCEFGYIGGRWSGKVRMGNAVELWAGLPNICIEDATIKNNWFYQTYDSAVTWQGLPEDSVYRNITFSENLFEYNNADIEFWAFTGCKVENFYMDKNICRFTSMGWGTRTNDGGIRGIEGCISAGTDHLMPDDVENICFTNNILDCPARQVIHWNRRPEHQLKMTVSGNKFYIKSEYRTLEHCFQGLQVDPSEQRHFTSGFNKEDIIKNLYRFGMDTEIHWDE